MALHQSEGCIDETRRVDNFAGVHRREGYVSPGEVSCVVEDTGNGFIARFPSYTSTRQDYYVCLDYTQARDLVLAMSEFQKELGFTPPKGTP